MTLVANIVCAESVATNGYTWTYSITDGKATITAVNPQPTGELITPSILNGCTVEGIGNNTFYGYNSITNVTIPNGVKHIGDYAFHCENMESLELPSSLRSIGKSAFERCFKLKTVILPSGVTSIGEYAFDCDESIPELEFPDTLSTIGRCALCKCAGLKILKIPFVGRTRGTTGTSDSIFGHIFGTALGGVSGIYRIVTSYADGVSVNRAVPESLETVIITDETLVPYGAFSGWDRIKSIHINNGVTAIGARAFDGCCNLTNMVIPASVSNIGSLSFRGCVNLGRVILPNNIGTLIVGEDAFDATVEVKIADKAGYVFCGWTNTTGTVVIDPFHGGNMVTVSPCWKLLQVTPPVITPTEDVVFVNISQTVAISCTENDTAIFYTTDGSDPAVNGREYKGEFNVYESCTIRAIARGAERDSDETSITLTRADGLGEAVNMYGYLMESDSTFPWTVVTDVSHDGVSCVRSGAIGNNGTTAIQTSVKKAGTLSFWWRAACEEPDVEDGADGYYDYGAFVLDGVEAARIAGNDTGWQFFSTNITTGGKHVFRWEYRKDGATAYVPDCVWLDQVQWIPADDSGHTLTTPDPVPYSWLSGYGLGLDSDFETAAKQLTGKMSATGKPMAVWQDFVAGTNPTDSDDFLRTMIAFSNGVPYVSWSPNLNTNGEVRVYTILGKTNLTDAAWVCPTNAAHRFFKVKVEMP